MAFSNLAILIIPPFAGGIIGYFTNDLAITMLFRPYKTLYFLGRKVPFTPGLIPHNQERLAQKVADAIMGSLLTPTELENLARKLLKTERVQAAILWLLNLFLEQVRLDKQQKTAQILAQILRDLVGESLPRLIRVLSRREDFLEEQINHVFDQILLDLKLNESQSRQLADWILTEVIPPNILRQFIIDFLTDRNIQVIDEGFREKTSGTYWVVANLFGLRNSLLRLRSFCLDEKEVANLRLKELILSLEIRNRLRDVLQNISLQSLPVSTVRQLRKTTRETIRNYLKEEGIEVLQGLSASVDWDKISILIVNRLQSSNAVTSSLEVVSEELAFILERYLEKDLEKIVSQAIPILSIDQVIIARVKATPAEELEQNIKAIVKSELQAIVNLGGVLGFVIGLLQTSIFIFQ